MENLQQYDEGLSKFYAAIYKWMAIGVAFSGVIAWLFLQSGHASLIFNNPVLFYGLIGIQLALLFGVQWFMNKLSHTASFVLYFAYAGVTGVLSSYIFAVYDLGNILGVFAASVLMFGALALYGYTTKKDLSGWGVFLFAAMWGVFAVSIINAFLQSEITHFVVSIIAIIVFAGLTVYENQHYKNIYYQVKDNEELKDKMVTQGALHMYINFIMIFRNLLYLVNRN